MTEQPRSAAAQDPPAEKKSFLRRLFDFVVDWMLT